MGGEEERRAERRELLNFLGIARVWGSANGVTKDNTCARIQQVLGYCECCHDTNCPIHLILFTD